MKDTATLESYLVRLKSLNRVGLELTKKMVTFCPLKCLQLDRIDDEKIALIVLNKDSSEGLSDTAFCKLWRKSVFRACTDGGANFVFDMQLKYTNGNGLGVMPDIVSGDFDSIRPEVKKFYEDQNETSVIHTPDQDYTDFTKCVNLIAEKMHNNTLQANLIVAIGGNQDRFDHSMSNISTLYSSRKKLPDGVRICLIFGSSFVCILPEGRSCIKVDTGLEGKWCGLVPVGRPVTVSTTGLKWNLTQGKLEFGHLVSTSNEIDGSKEVTVDTDHPLVWTMEFNLNT